MDRDRRRLGSSIQGSRLNNDASVLGKGGVHKRRYIVAGGKRDMGYKYIFIQASASK